MKTQIDNLRCLFIGREDDHGVCVVEIDCSAWKKKYPQLTDYRIEVTSPEKEIYFPVVKMIGDMLVWEITQEDTGAKGSGRYQVVATGANGAHKTSQNAEIIVMSVMDGTNDDTPPDPSKPWTDRVYEAAKNVEETAKRLEEMGGVTDEQISEAVESYFEKNPSSGGTSINDDEPSENETYSSQKIEKKFESMDDCVDHMIEVSDDEPTEESTELWFKPNSDEIHIPEINDNEASEYDTYSSKKIEDLLSKQKEAIDSKVGTDELNTAVEDALTEAKNSGDFKGDPGEPGYTPQKGVDYFDGAPGEPGKDGHTPEKGVDYWTQEDRQQIVTDVLAALPNASGVSF